MVSRAEAGTYAFPFEATGRKEITAGELSALLEGLDLRQANGENGIFRRRNKSLEARINIG
jgi:hypothetical protein